MNDIADPPAPPGPSGPGTAAEDQPRGSRRSADEVRDVARLRRSDSDRKLAGVAGGLARHLDLDPLLVRVVLVVSILFGGAGLVLYGLLWLFVPDDDGHAVFDLEDSTRTVVVWVAIAMAVLVLLGQATAWSGPPLPVIALIVVVVAVLLNRDRARQERAAGVPPATSAPSAASAWTPAAPTARARRRARGPLLLGPTLALVLVACGVLGLVEATGADLPDAPYPAAALAIVGAALVLGAWFGRTGGLVLAGLVAALGVGAAGASDGPWGTGPDHLVQRPVLSRGLDAVYDVDHGQVTLDLRRIRDLAALDGREVAVTLGAGEVDVLLPAGLTADVRADVSGPGEVTIAGETAGGFDTTLARTIRSTDPAAPQLTLRLHSTVGTIDVRSAS